MLLVRLFVCVFDLLAFINVYKRVLGGCVELLRYRCVSKHAVNLELNDMGQPVQVCFEAVGTGVLSVLNNYQSCSPIISPAQAARLNVGAEYVFEMVEVEK